MPWFVYGHDCGHAGKRLAEADGLLTRKPPFFFLPPGPGGQRGARSFAFGGRQPDVAFVVAEWIKLLERSEQWSLFVGIGGGGLITA